MPTLNKIRDLVAKDRFELMMRCPFYGRIICSAELVIVRDTKVLLACTDYSRIFISGDAYSALPEGKRLAVLAHEVLHIALRHAFRIGYRDKNRFEKAADAEVTFVLTESFPDPYGVKVKTEWRKLTAEQIYELLPSSEDKTKAKSKHCFPDDDIQDGSESEDKQAVEDDTRKPDDRDKERDDKNDKSENRDSEPKNKPLKCKSAKKKSDSKGSADDKQSNADDGSGNGDDGSGDGDDGSGDGDDGSGDGDDGSGDGTPGGAALGGAPAGGSGDGDGNKDIIFSEFRPRFDLETEMNCISLSSETLMDIQRFGDGFGKRNGFSGFSPSLEYLLNNLNTPHVKWKVLLRQFLRLCRGGSYSWTRPNRRFISRGLYLPGRQTKSFSGIVGLDTSGSTLHVLPQFMSELTGLIKDFGKFDLTIIECDTRIQQVWTVSSNEPLPDFTQHIFKGGGDNDFNPFFEYIRDQHLNPNVLIFFTDGYTICPEEEPPYPVLWMLTKDGVAPVPWGQVIYYEEN